MFWNIQKRFIKTLLVQKGMLRPFNYKFLIKVKFLVDNHETE